MINTSLKVGYRIKPVLYTSEKHRNKILKALHYEDSGEIIVNENNIEFIGKKNLFKIEDIQQISRVSSHTRQLAEWIQIIYKNKNNNIKTVNFIKMDKSMRKGSKINTDEFYKNLIEWNNKGSMINNEELSSKESIEDKFKKLKDLYEKELISKEEYNKKRNDILKDI